MIDPNDMSDEQLRAEVAEWVGWTCLKEQVYYEGDLVDLPNGKLYGVPLLTGVRCEVPNYPHDLNAVHEAEKKLNDNQLSNYGYRLQVITLGGSYTYVDNLMMAKFARADARQRCIALVRTVRNSK